MKRIQFSGKSSIAGDGSVDFVFTDNGDLIVNVEDDHHNGVISITLSLSQRIALTNALRNEW